MSLFNQQWYDSKTGAPLSYDSDTRNLTVSQYVNGWLNAVASGVAVTEKSIAAHAAGDSASKQKFLLNSALVLGALYLIYKM